MKCIWCHNPESRSPQIQSIEKELRLDGKIHHSTQTVGKEMTVKEVISEIKKDIIFYEESGGGVTFSGGEVFLQDKFLILLLSECKKNDIFTCIDTTGYVSEDVLKQVIPITDLFLFDIKLMDVKEHEKYCGVSNKQILKNFKTIYESESDIRLRFPVIPGITDTEHNTKALAEFASGFENLQMDMIPYHSTGRDKYRRLGMDYFMEDIQQPTEERMKELELFFKNHGIRVRIGG
ncbi:MAG: glycyl-radical enzyme activating protein [Denitrovibrio sp.]|nr:MAG: glycyl-radical enzyme activating protein [Denitrovibrio sp.]